MGMIACYQIVDEEIVRNLFNKSSEEVFEIIEELQEDAEVLDIDKMWDGLHFLLTNVTASEPIVGSTLSEAIVGSERFCDEEDADFISYILPDRVKNIFKELQAFDIERAINGFNPKAFAQNGIYPNIWMHEEKEELMEELSCAFSEMLRFYKKCDEENKAVIVSIY